MFITTVLHWCTPGRHGRGLLAWFRELTSSPALSLHANFARVDATICMRISNDFELKKWQLVAICFSFLRFRDKGILWDGNSCRLKGGEPGPQSKISLRESEVQAGDLGSVQGGWLKQRALSGAAVGPRRKWLNPGVCEIKRVADESKRQWDIASHLLGWLLSKRNNNCW